MDDIVIVSAARTPVGSFSGALGTLAAHELGTVALQAAFERAGVEAADVDEVILGQVLAAGEGQNPARQAARAAGLPDAKTAFGINQVCGSGLRAVALAAQQIRTGESAIVAAGGMESMSLSQHSAYLRAGQKMGGLEFIDTMLKDGLWDAFHGYHMGNTAENVASKYQITREQQDQFALASQQKASAAQKSGRFKDEIAPVTVKTRKGDVVVSDDEYIRHDASIETMARLRPAFSKDGTVTAGNASGINDGAAALVLMSASEAAKRGLKPLARIAAFATAGVDPAVMGTGPIPGHAQGAGARGMEDRRPGPDRGQRSVRRAGARGEQGPRLGHRQGERERRRDCHRSPDRCVRCARADHAAARNAEARCEEGVGNAVHRRRHGRGNVRGALAAKSLARRSLSWPGLVPAMTVQDGHTV